MVGNAHIDPVWLWPWQEGYQEARATFRSALDRMNEYEDFIFTCDQMVLLSWVRECDPGMFEEIKERVAQGRWVNVGGWWIEPDCNIPFGESFMRQGLIGQAFLQENFGRRATVGLNADPFGHHGMLPQILRQQGLTSYCFLRPGPHEHDLPGGPFWWQSPDGSRVLAYRIPHEYCSPGGDVSYHTEKAVAQLDSGTDEHMVFYGVGNHGGGPTKRNIASIHRYDRLGTFGALTMSSPPAYFDAVRAAISKQGDELPVVSGDLQHHAPGCYSAVPMIKQEQRRAQWAVLSAERWAAIAERVADIDYAYDDLDVAWKQVLFNQFHDVLPGSAIESAYVDARDQLGEAVALSKRIITRSHNAIAGRISIPFDEATFPMVAFNPHPWPVRTILEMERAKDGSRSTVVDDAGTPVPAQVMASRATTEFASFSRTAFIANLPALGYRLYRMTPGMSVAPQEPVQVGTTWLENRRLRLDLDERTGRVAHLVDKATGIDFVPGAPQQRIHVLPDDSDTWGHRVVSYVHQGTEPALLEIKIVEGGPLRAALRVTSQVGTSTIIETFSLDAYCDEIRIAVRIDWRGGGQLVKLRYPVGVEDPQATYEIPFGHISRPVNGAEEPGQSWVDISGRVDDVACGLTVINNAKSGYDTSPADSPARGNTPSVGITALRSPVYSWHDPHILDESVDHTYQAQGLQEFDVVLVPHGNEWTPASMSKRAALLGLAPRVMFEHAHCGELGPAGSFMNAPSAAGIIITAVKNADDRTGDLVVRAYEADGVECDGVTLGIPCTTTSTTVDFLPHCIRTFRITSDGKAREVNALEENL